MGPGAKSPLLSLCVLGCDVSAVWFAVCLVTCFMCCCLCCQVLLCVPGRWVCGSFGCHHVSSSWTYNEHIASMIEHIALDATSM